MRQTATGRTPTRRTVRATLTGLVVVMAAIAGILINRSASASPPSFGEVVSGDIAGATQAVHGPLSEDDGILPDRVTPFDDEYPGIANLDARLLRGLRAATTDAAGDGVEAYVNSGWRSPEYQEQLFRQAVATYGSTADAGRWVATPGRSAHELGEAVDIGPPAAAAWLSEHGAADGLCQIYRNEPWHFELRPEAVRGRCPRMYADPTHDPRLQ